MISAANLIAKIKEYNPEINENRIQKAYIFSKTGHGNQKRHSGETYFSHPLAVAEILIELKMDEDSIISALLHDIVEDTDITLEDIEREFGDTVTKLVDGVTKLNKIEHSSINERVVENLRKLTLAMSQDIRVLLIKLADRLHNMRTLYYVPSKEKKLRKAKESLEIYAPLAARIGLNRIKDEIQELAFAITEPKNHDFIVEKLNKLITKKKDFIDKVIKQLSTKLKKEKVEFEIAGRQKTPYSIYNKMKIKNVGFHHLYDIMAFRIIVKNISECYRVLGIINSSYNMIPSTFHDYISTPKENGYRSLHLAVLGPFNKKIEIQIRDQQMHKEAELGVASHWSYKDSAGKKTKTSKKTKDENKQYQWIRDLISLFENSSNANELLTHNRLDAHKDEVFCFTPNGDIFNLPLNSTAIDFAYNIHSEIGNSCSGAKINGVIAPLRQKLENGDQVEIITTKNAKPSPNWLQFAITSKAKSAIKASIRNEKFQEHTKLGLQILKKYFLAQNKHFDEDIIEKTLPKFNLKDTENLYVKVAEGRIRRNEVIKAAYPEIKDEPSPKFGFKNKKSKDYSLPIDGLIPQMAVNFAGCCNPVPGDLIVGVINTGTGVTIHNQSCNNLKNLLLSPQRIIDVYWKDNNENADFLYSCRIRLTAINKSGTLASVTNIIAKKKVNITNINITNRNEDFFELAIDTEIKNTEQIEETLSALRLSSKIIDVERI